LSLLLLYKIYLLPENFNNYVKHYRQDAHPNKNHVEVVLTLMHKLANYIKRAEN